MQLQISLPGYEELTVQLNELGEISAYDLQTSTSTLELFENLLGRYGRKVAHWNLVVDLPEGSTPSERRSHFLIGELIARARGLWALPYAGEMVCNCRQVTSEQIDHAIVAGAVDVTEVSQWTTACTSCTSCRGKIEEIVACRTGLSAKLSTLSRVKRPIF